MPETGTIQGFKDYPIPQSIPDAHLGRVDIHRVARTDPTSWIIAAKLVSVLS